LPDRLSVALLAPAHLQHLGPEGSDLEGAEARAMTLHTYKSVYCELRRGGDICVWGVYCEGMVCVVYASVCAYLQVLALHVGPHHAGLLLERGSLSVTVEAT
jgi:hypothetical protein